MPNGRSACRARFPCRSWFVETRLGTFLGKEKAFYTLASMASSRRPEAISTYVAQLPGSTAADRQSWIQQRMEQRSDWAYKELVALLKNIRSSGEDALTMPGSIYGATGCASSCPRISATTEPTATGTAW